MENEHQIALNWLGKCPYKDQSLPPIPPLVEIWCEPLARLYRADCLSVPQLTSRPKLVYMDPPFDMGEKFVARLKLANGVTIQSPVGFKDSWGTDGIEYLNFMYHRFGAIRDWMHPDGLLCVHIDQHANSRMRLLLDEVFGRKQFVNEIIWSYRSGGGSKKALGHKHDTLYLYRKSEHYTFNPDAVRVPYDASIASKREHLFNPAGKVSGDVWDISRPPNHSTEWLGYPTQKPTALLDRLMSCFSNEGDLVADPFCGCGSWLEVAHRLGRSWVGMDVGTLAVHMTRRRMLSVGARFGVYGSEIYPGGGCYQSAADGQPVLEGYHPACLDQHPELSNELSNPADWCDLLAEGQLHDGCFHARRYWTPRASWVDLTGVEPHGKDVLAFDALGYGQLIRSV